MLVTALGSIMPVGDRVRQAGFLGAELQNLSDEERTKFNPAGKRGISLVRAVPGGPAEHAGLKSGDILLSVEGNDIATVQQLIDATREHVPGSSMQLRLLREGKEIDVSVILGAMTLRDWIPLLLDTSAGDVSWLIRDHALTVLPAVSSLKALRDSAKPAAANRKPYLAFANPLLEGEAGNSDDKMRAEDAARKTDCVTVAKVRAIEEMAGAFASFRAKEAKLGGAANVNELRQLPPVPQTADLVCGVAQALGADEADIHLAARATEASVKAMSASKSASDTLAAYAVVNFATHGAVAGELKGSAEPGLVLTPPKEGSDEDDGYLSASEVVGLKLDADWVILSACNTAAGGAENAEALSGLARAFFYAGARALLVSHWPVREKAAVALVTRAIDAAAHDKSVGRAEAMREAMLALADSPDAVIAHPSYWAPFVVVGEGAGGQ